MGFKRSGVVALMILVELLALVKSQNFTYVGFKRCGVVALMILVELLALVKSQNFTCVCFKCCGVVALMILIPILVESLALVNYNVCIFLWRCGVEDPREKRSRK